MRIILDEGDDNDDDDVGEKGGCCYSYKMIFIKCVTCANRISAALNIMHIYIYGMMGEKRGEKLSNSDCPTIQQLSNYPT